MKTKNGISINRHLKQFCGIKIYFYLVFVSVPPKVNPLLRNQSVPLNSTFKIKCYVKGDPPPKVNWSKDGSDLRIKENTLTIDSVTYEDGGWYGCSAKNWAGRIQPNFWIDVTGKSLFYFTFHEISRCNAQT